MRFQHFWGLEFRMGPRYHTDNVPQVGFIKEYVVEIQFYPLWLIHNAAICFCGDTFGRALR